MKSVSVVVIGAGPAGSLTAYLLARAGIDVEVIERRLGDRPDRGEVLAAEGRSVLARVGLWDRRPDAALLPCESTRIAWRPGPTMERFAITNPYGCAWHVNRTAFDGWLLDEAVIAGARTARPASVRGVRRGAAGWELGVATPSGTTRYVTARVVVHAGGRCSTHADWFGATPRRYDALCAVIGRSAEEGDVTGGLVVEATPDGWWYSTMSDGGVITALVTDPDVLVASGRHGTAMRAALERAPLTWLRVRSLRNTIATVSACSAALDPASGDGWLAVGDAAIARDPLSGEGLLSAMRSAIAAAEAVEGHLRGDSLALVAYASQVRAWKRAYLVARRSVYAGQTRWSDRPFWRRRRASMDGRLKPMDGVYVDRQG